MSDPTEHLARWRRAGLIDQSTADRVLAFERGPLDGRSERLFAPAERPGVIEALLYLGVAVTVVGVFSLFQQQWSELKSWARLAAVGVPTALTLLAGGGMRLFPDPGVRRAGQVAWLASVVLSAGTLAVGFEEYGEGAADRNALLASGAAAAVLAAILWALSPAHLQLLALGSAGVFFGEALAAWPDDYSTPLAGVTIGLLGATGVGLTEAGVITPRLSARAVFGFLAMLGAYHAGIESSIGWEFVSFAAGAGLIIVSLVRGTFTYMAIGVVGIFVALTTFIFEHFENELGAPFAFILSGALLVAGVLVLAQALSVRRRHLPPQ